MNETFSDRLKLKMKESEYTQKQLAELVGVTEAAFSRYMTTKRIPKAEIVANLATALHTTTDYLLYGKDTYKDYAELRGIVARSMNKLTSKQKKDLADLLQEINNKSGK